MSFSSHRQHNLGLWKYFSELPAIRHFWGSPCIMYSVYYITIYIVSCKPYTLYSVYYIHKILLKKPGSPEPKVSRPIHGGKITSKQIPGGAGIEKTQVSCFFPNLQICQHSLTINRRVTFLHIYMWCTPHSEKRQHK